MILKKRVKCIFTGVFYLFEAKR